MCLINPLICSSSAFDSHVNGEYLPIIVLETQAASTAPTTAGGPPRQLDIPFLDSLSERVMDVMFNEHKLRVYCVMVTAPNTLPRIIKNGRREIGNMLCRKEFENGSLACVHVKFGVERAVINLPIGDDPIGGIWSSLATQRRQQVLMTMDKQYSGVDYRQVVIDDRTSAPLNQFTNIHDLMQFRVARHPEELSYCSIDSRGREGKGINWRKLDQKVAAVAVYLKNKVKIQQGDHVLLMYTHSEDFVFAVHACMCLGAVAIPMAPLDQGRLNEDAPALLHIIADFKIRVILVNNDVDSVFKQKTVSQHLRQSATILRVNIPNIHNTSKPSRQNHGCRELGLTIRPNWTQSSYPVVVWVYWTPDQRRIAVQLGHDTLMALCKVQKETCQMTSSRPIIGCVRSTIGLGFIHTCLIGIYLSSPTYLVSPVDFAQTPNVLFHTLSRYKIKDTYATSNMLDHAMAHGAGKTASLQELKNLMITTETRPRVDVYQKVRVHFAQAGLDRTAINTIYSHVLNPMVTSRSYMCVEPIELWLDRLALRRGIIAPVHPESDPTALLIQDSGMVPVSTQISIVNPETNCLCLVGELGEIWVQSEANVHSFYGSKDILDSERFNGRTLDGDRSVRYMRTGDLGFLHNVARPIGPNGNLVDMQVLFVLGSIGETFEVTGLCHFPTDIEASVERCHRNIVAGGW
jgi:acyl-CoA synthetase (AMP-forming)/AMP-acid ligase II